MNAVVKENISLKKNKNYGISKCSEWLSICLQACFDVHHFGAYEHRTAKKYIKNMALEDLSAWCRSTIGLNFPSSIMI